MLPWTRGHQHEQKRPPAKHNIRQDAALKEVVSGAMLLGGLELEMLPLLDSGLKNLGSRCTREKPPAQRHGFSE